MNNLKVSLIVAVYKDVNALQLIVKALEHQTYKNFELIVAEDNNSSEMKDFIKSVDAIDIQHVSQDDKGIRKVRSINNGILKSSGEYLIFIDGDCIPYSTFIEGHLLLAEKKQILSGRRVNLDPVTSSKLRAFSLTTQNLEKRFFWHLPFMAYNGGSHLSQGYRFHPDHFIYKQLLKKRKRNLSLLGCNLSCFREDILAINGFDESYGETAVADDTDLQWRFEAYGLSFRSCKNIANVFHLFHTREHRERDSSAEVALMMKRKEIKHYFCDDGLNTH